MKLINTRINDELAELVEYVQKTFPGVSQVSFLCQIEIEGDFDLEELRKFAPKLVALPPTQESTQRKWWDTSSYGETCMSAPLEPIEASSETAESAHALAPDPYKGMGC